MAGRKPAGASFETWVDAQIRAARERGEFENLPGHGKPLPTITGDDDDLWWIRQWLRREDITYTPPALALRKSVEDMLAGVGNLESEQAVRDVVARLNESIREMNRKPPVNGPPTSLSVLKVDEVLARWAAQRTK